MKQLTVILFLCSYSIQAQVINFSSPPTELKLFGEGFISTAINERDFAISPDGMEIYYTVSTPKSTFQTIVFSKKIKGEWTKPTVASFAGRYSDLEPAFSADGKTLYFASNRPLNGTEIKDFDIWKVMRQGENWSEPINLGNVVNTTTDEFYPSVAKNGNLYFTASYKDGPGREDIYQAIFKDNTYQKPVPLDTAVNTKFYEFNAFVDPAEQYIIFTSYGRKDDTGGGDLYISRKNDKGQWMTAVNLKSINSKQLDYCPYVSPDGKSLFITSDRHSLPIDFSQQPASYQDIVNSCTQVQNGTGNIYWIDFSSLLKLLVKKER
ncbi:exo-alpha-sialidase [Chryseotalea sanaruensis]|uniref:Exo-alpha-sialidase n=1 Tax=Chryseotalea sanaruensis TaxID=2482724 RepID=A0A401U593_9BACT|nr:PD40 domain-containing protein [Chryseotalea sanaruensis]GCC50088.1 exo-alpha-sialidase [Chryseotalea sanaruensis]